MGRKVKVIQNGGWLMGMDIDWKPLRSQGQPWRLKIRVGDTSQISVRVELLVP